MKQQQKGWMKGRIKDKGKITISKHIAKKSSIT